jgi:hypothetical protein
MQGACSSTCSTPRAGPFSRKTCRLAQAPSPRAGDALARVPGAMYPPVENGLHSSTARRDVLARVPGAMYPPVENGLHSSTARRGCLGKGAGGPRRNQAAPRRTGCRLCGRGRIKPSGFCDLLAIPGGAVALTNRVFTPKGRRAEGVKYHLTPFGVKTGQPIAARERFLGRDLRHGHRSLTGQLSREPEPA